MRNIVNETKIAALYKAALAADDVFQAAVIRQFGRKNAGTMRYLGSEHNAETKSAAVAFWQANKEMLDAMEAARKAEVN